MKRFIEGEDRSQVTLLPECLDDFIAEDNPIRVVDVFVEELDLAIGALQSDPDLWKRIEHLLGRVGDPCRNDDGLSIAHVLIHRAY